MGYPEIPQGALAPDNAAFLHLHHAEHLTATIKELCDFFASRQQLTGKVNLGKDIFFNHLAQIIEP